MKVQVLDYALHLLAEDDVKRIPSTMLLGPLDASVDPSPGHANDQLLVDIYNRI